MNFNLIPLGKGLEQKLADIGVRYDPITGDRENAPLLDQGSDDSE